MKFFPYFYRVTIDKVLDGDTVDAVFDLGFCISHKVRVRLAGYDAPETYRPVNEAERLAGYLCRDKLAKMLKTYSGDLYCRSTKIDLYGRSTGIFYCKEPLGEYCELNWLMGRFITENHYTKKELRNESD